MIILSLRTDKPKAEIGLYNDAQKISYVIWQADRALAETIHQKIFDLLQAQSLTWQNIQGIVVFQGPGSFTGLRIGITVVNALAASLHIPICAGMGDDWLKKSLSQLLAGANQVMLLPEYGSAPNVSQPKK